MDEHAKLAAMIDLANSLNVTVRRTSRPGGSPDRPGGDFVRLKGKEIVFLDPTASPTDQIAVLAEVLREKKQLQQTFLPPELRELLEDPDSSWE